MASMCRKIYSIRRPKTSKSNFAWINKTLQKELEFGFTYTEQKSNIGARRQSQGK